MFNLKRMFIMILLCLFLKPLPMSAASGDAGTEGPFAFGVEARAISLGRAYTGVAEDASAVYWNPGALAYLEQKEFSSLYVPLYAGTDYGFLAFVYPVSGFGTLGLGLLGISVRDIPKTDEYDNNLGEFSDLQLQLSISYSRVWWRNIAAGLNVLLYHHMLDTYNGTGIGLEAGVYYDAREFLPNLTLGLKATNALSPRVTLISEPDLYPLNLRLGAAYRYALDQAENHRLLLSLEGEKSEFANFRIHAGFEYLFFKLFALRAGWDHDHLTTGAGVTYEGWRMDYALTLQGANGLNHLFSLGWRFGKSLSAEALQERQKILSELKVVMSRQYNQKGLKYLQAKNYKAAMDEFENALSWIEKSTEISNNFQKAQQSWNRKLAEKKYQAGRRHFKKKAYIEALLAWRETAKLQPGYPGLQKRINQVKRRMKKQLAGKAARSLRAKSQPDKRALDLFDQGVALYLNEQYAKAIVKWQAALKIKPDLPRVKGYITTALLQQPLKAPSRDVTPTSSALIQQEVAKYYEEGLLKYRQRDFVQAHSRWRRVLELDPNHIGAKRGVERVKAILSAFEEHGIQ